MRDIYSGGEIAGKLLHVIYSPHGAIEGVMLQSPEGMSQLVFAEEPTGALFQQGKVGSSVVAHGEFIGWSSTKQRGHRVYNVDRVRSVDGKKPPAAKAIRRAPVYSGTVVALNYARHGEANGVILDSGDFIHLKPEGFKRMKLAIGDSVDAYGDAYELHAERGYVVEAHRVNGKKLL